ncbi:MAG TPA: ABC transporter permease [Prolixibacteraceae bacterium]
MIKNYFKIAWRNLIKNKVISSINIVGLATGMTAAVLILIWVQNEMNFDNDHQQSECIYRLTTKENKGNWIWESTPLLLADAAKKEIPEIEKTARLNNYNSPVFNIDGNLIIQKKCAYVDGDWFGIFHYDFIEGNSTSFGEDLYSVILTASEAKKYFGNRKALNETIRIDNKDYFIKGIVADAPSNSSFQYNAFIPLAALLTNKELRENDENWDNANYITFTKLKASASPLVVAEKLTGVYQKNSGSKEGLITLISLKDMHFEAELQSSEFVHGNKTTVYIFSALAFLLLLVACINYVNLTTAKASLRGKEVSIKKMIGAKRKHLFYQFMIESLMVSFLSLVVTLLLIHISLPAFNSLTGKDFVLPLSSIRIWRIIGITLLVAILLNSIYPALLLSSFKPLNVFRGFTVLKVKDSYFRKGLVIVQFTISVMLIASTIVIYRQMKFVQQTNPGYSRELVLSFPLPAGVENDKKELLMQAIKQNLLTQSSIQSVTLANQSIINIGSISTGSADWNGHDDAYNPKIAQLSTDADFQKTMQLQLKEGRWFVQGNIADRNNVVLNETAVNDLKIPAPVIGQRFTFKGRRGEIIGVVKDFHYKSMHDKTGPLIAFNDPQWYRFLMVRTSQGNASKAVQDIQSAWKKFLPGSPLEYSFLDDAFNDLYKEDQKASFFIFIFSIIAIMISALGLFGLAAFTAEQRTKEIGIRKVLGASISTIISLLSKDFIGLVAIAILIASPIAWWGLNNWIQNFAYRIDISWWMFVAAGCVAIVIALVTVSFQAVKAAIANPIKSLRTE